MIAVLDANTLFKSPHCDSAVWRVLAFGAHSWGLTIVVPESVVIETVANHERVLNEARTKWEGWSKETFKLFSEQQRTSREQIKNLLDSATNYEAELRDALHKANAKVLVGLQVSGPDRSRADH